MTYNGINLLDVLEVAERAGLAIMEIYRSGDFGTEDKPDKTPLTKADRAAHEIIAQRLGKLTPDIPILSEEGKEIPYNERESWDRLWIVDPLDGTKEFLKKNDEFTVNIALVEKGEPVLGVIQVPACEESFIGLVNSGALYIEGGGKPEKIACRTADPANLVAMRSRSHAKPAEEALHKALNVRETVAAGSSLKFCRIAQGKADLYFRAGPTSEWDTAAGHAILQAAGGNVRTPQGPLPYNRKDIINPPFLCLGPGVPEHDYFQYLEATK